MQELVNMGIRDRDVLRAIRAVPREEFVPSVLRGELEEEARFRGAAG